MSVVTTVIVTVPIRNIPGTARWASDFTFGDPGLLTPAWTLLRQLSNTDFLTDYLIGGRFVWGGDFTGFDEGAFVADLEPFLQKWWEEVPRAPQGDDVFLVFLQRDDEELATTMRFTNGHWVMRPEAPEIPQKDTKGEVN